MEEDEDSPNTMPPWVELEYAVSILRFFFFLRSSPYLNKNKHMRILAGPDAQVHFTYLSKSSSQSLDSAFTVKPQNPSLAAFSCHQEGVLDLMKTSGMPIDKVCLLDPKAEQELSPEDGDNFQWFLFGVSSNLWCPASQKQSYSDIHRGSSVNRFCS